MENIYKMLCLRAQKEDHFGSTIHAEINCHGWAVSLCSSSGTVLSSFLYLMKKENNFNTFSSLGVYNAGFFVRFRKKSAMKKTQKTCFKTRKKT